MSQHLSDFTAGIVLAILTLGVTAYTFIKRQVASDGSCRTISRKRFRGLSGALLPRQWRRKYLTTTTQAKKENKMGNISRAMEQMERGLASKQGRDEVNAETMDQREQRQRSEEERLADVAAIPAPEPTVTWQDRLQRATGELGLMSHNKSSDDQIAIILRFAGKMSNMQVAEIARRIREYG